MVPAQIKSQAGRYSTAGTRYSASGTRYSEPASRYSQPGTTGTAGTTKQFFFSFLFLFLYIFEVRRGGTKFNTFWSVSIEIERLS